jgi:heat shock protein HslJ
MARHDADSDLQGDWLVVGIGGEPVDPGAPRAVRFEGDRMSGQVGVNRFTGSFSIDGDVLEAGPAASTRMAGPPELMALESRFHSHLQGEHEISLEGDELMFGRGERAIVLTRAPSFTVEGTVAYRKRIMMPPDSVVTVELFDISIADVAIDPIATQVIAGAAGPPIPFSLSSAEEIDERRRLAVRARVVSADGDLLWRTDTPAVLSTRDEPVELMLRRGC